MNETPERLKSDIDRIGNDPSGNQIGTAVAKAVHSLGKPKQARPPSPPPALPGIGKLKKPVVRKLEASGSLRKLKA